MWRFPARQPFFAFPFLSHFNYFHSAFHLIFNTHSFNLPGMSREEPLLAQRPSSDHSSLRNAEEEDALLTGERTDRHEREQGRNRAFWREIGLFAWALIATIVVVVLAVVYQHEASRSRPASTTWGPGGKPTGKRNMIFMVSDGMGPTSLEMTRSFRQWRDGLSIDDLLVLDQHAIGSSRTRSSDTLVTDSAAGATAFSCGFKSYNGAIAVLPDHSPCGTVLEAASLAGYKTGLVVTTRMTDATPACFASHANLRGYEDSIAEQEIGEHPLGRVVDLMMGGGRCHFLPNTTRGSCRGDDRDLTQVASKNGFNYIHTLSQLDELNDETKLPLLGLFAENDIPYEIDRRSQNNLYPSLEEMSRSALKALSKATENSEKGFFLMIEGSRIDHAGHDNDPAAQVHEVLAFDKAFAAALEFLEHDSTPGVLVSTSDHETGGLSAARQLHKSYPEYLWYPGVLANASHSNEYVAAKLEKYLSGTSKDTSESKQVFVQGLLEKDLGIKDASDKEVNALLHPDPKVSRKSVVADMISRRAQIGWSTHGHSGKSHPTSSLPLLFSSCHTNKDPAVDVNIYASSSKHAWPLVGNHENTEIGVFLANYLGVDVDSVTKKLQSSAHWTPSTKEAPAEDSFRWLGDPLGSDVRTEGLDTYHGDFKKRSLEDYGGGIH